MIFLVVALACEARPLIDHFQLKLIESSPYRLYQKDQIQLIISKSGTLNAACATTHLMISNPKASPTWINVGVAGHKDAPLETCFLASKVTSPNLPKTFYPHLPFKSPLPKSPLQSLDQPSDQYLDHTLFDMEGYGFFTAANKYSSIEKVHALKVVSDNADHHFAPLQQDDLSNYIEKSLEPLERCIVQFEKLKEPLLHHLELTHFQNRWHFSKTQLLRLEYLLNHLNYHNSSGCELKYCKDHTTSRSLLKYLEEKLSGIPIL